MAGKKNTRFPIVGPSGDEQLGEVKATLNYLKDDFVVMKDELKVMNQTLAVNTEQLKVHIEGVKLAREQNQLLRQDIDSRFSLLKQDVDSKFTPLQTHVTKAQAYGKVGMWVARAILAPLLLWGIIEAVKLIIGVVKS